MKTSQVGLKLIKDSESLRLQAYPDPATHSAPWTIGYGHTGPEVHQGLRISPAQADTFLVQDVTKAEKELSALIKVSLTQNQWDALVDFVFNLGSGALAGSHLLQYINMKKFAEAAAEFDRWVYANHIKMPGLVKRRASEKSLFIK